MSYTCTNRADCTHIRWSQLCSPGGGAPTATSRNPKVLQDGRGAAVVQRPGASAGLHGRAHRRGREAVPLPGVVRVALCLQLHLLHLQSPHEVLLLREHSLAINLLDRGGREHDHAPVLPLVDRQWIPGELDLRQEAAGEQGADVRHLLEVVVRQVQSPQALQGRQAGHVLESIPGRTQARQGVGDGFDGARAELQRVASAERAEAALATARQEGPLVGHVQLLQLGEML
mmetsp:Transcript_90790/g.293122  ORF Transcript_90790/g.293122 Transcript_90790/m.293122 type:complete len:230 (-) Transcript_90790:445-1134(-)